MRELEVAKRIARQAGELLMAEKGSKLEVVIKDDNSPCTQADRLSSEFITAELLREFPDYGIIDEESPSQNIMPDTRYRWVVDPLDGTISYIKGGEYFGVMIGLLYGNNPILGVTYRPMVDELAFAAAGMGAFTETKGIAKQIRINDSSDYHERDILVSMLRDDEELEKLRNLFGKDHVRGMPSAFKTVEVAKGNASAFFCPRSITMNLWDLCAAQAILEEAGGRFTDIYGKPIDYDGDFVNRKGVIASNKLVHQEILDAIGGREYSFAPKGLYTR
jgi:3'(2'),5'-bisphosphate nucleotidase